ncbi:hypothetical protein ENUP19_0057G0008 [Entamoeba nuttalli]|uniref:Uncharacterized protein n=2 Tax=Entamoeba nuttalli TaxID=412467 RepID=K2G4R2_ENTNP|nr:hypothetical protein ENU1_202510 [Entamoeba nuttalli P19]EKE37296.1 hypothetical protein ENU1_202510 [Entamoeba nuttalli P19]|eukprot:XP_008860369.1 hypothetical protein ENU1_202510 [Entamoeba nuttalli P19]
MQGQFIKEPTFIKTEKTWKEPKKDFRTVRNQQVYQQGILLALLNQYFDIEIRKPLKKAHSFEQLIRIHRLIIGSESIDVEKFCDHRCKEKFQKDLCKGINEKTAKRRLENIRIVEMVFLLMDILMEFGYLFDTSCTKGKKGTVKYERIQNIFYNGKKIYDYNHFISIGKSVNSYLLLSLSNQDSFYWKRGTGCSEIS